MKKTMISALPVSILVMSLFGLTSHAADVDTDHLMFPEDVELAEAGNEPLNNIRSGEGNQYLVADNNGRSTAKRNMMSRRYLTNPNNNKNQAYTADSEWVGASKVEENKQLSNDATRRLNHRFMSRRAFRPYDR